MKLTDGRVRRSKAMAHKNKELIKNWLVDKPDSTITEICRGVGLSYPTVRRHIDELAKEQKQATRG